MTDVDDRLDPQLRSALEAMPFPAISAKTLSSVRDAPTFRSDPSTLSAEVTRESVYVPGVDGAPDIHLRIHRPVGVPKSEALPCMYWMHGGGMVLGRAEQEDFRFDKWCARFNIAAVSVDYRLAPESPYPAAIDDCYNALVWVHKNAASIGIDAARLGIGGASAGAGLAAALSLMARDRGLPGPNIQSQLLIYPMIDDRQQTVSSGWNVPVWSPESNRFGWDSYLGNLDRDEVPAYAAAARATDLSGLPPALIVVGALDGFVDEDVDYALRLNRAGVEIELKVYAGAPHGFEGLYSGAGVSRRALTDINAWIDRKYAR